MPKPKISTDHPEFPHGTNAGYGRGCKCADCKKAHSEDVGRNHLKNHPEPKAPYRKHGGDKAHADFPHGLNAGYVAGCRCEACAEVHRVEFTAYSRVYRAPGTPGGLKKLAANATFRKSAKGIASSRKGNATRAARMRGAQLAASIGDQALVRMIYANCPIGFEVDHIVPLSQGGDHLPANLQYLPLRINRQKRDRLDFEAAEHAIAWQSILLDVPSTIIPLREYAQAGGSASDPSGSRYDLVCQETGSCSQERCESSELA